MRTSLHEKLHFLRGQEAEHAAHTARLSQIMAGRSTAPERVCVTTHFTLLKRLRVAYMTGWSDGVRIGLAWGVIVGFATACLVIAFSAGRLS